MKVTKWIVFILLILASFFLTSYIVFYYRADYGERFFDTLSTVVTLVLNNKQIHNLLMASVLLSLTSLMVSGIIGYYAARFSKFERILSFIPPSRFAIPEIFIIVVLDLIFSGFGARIRGLSSSGKFLLIFAVVVVRRWKVFNDYFKSALENYEDSIAYKLVISRGIRGLRLGEYRLKNTLMDSLSALSFEIPLMLSYISIMERVVVYDGISHNFFKALRESMTAGDQLMFAVPIIIFFIAVQILLKFVELFVWGSRSDVL